MSAHLSNEIVERFHAQALASGDRGVIYDHILNCESCRQRVVDSRTATVALDALVKHLLPQEGDEPYHLSFETIEAFVKDELDVIDRQTASLHLEDCAECATEVTDLRESLATMKTAPREHDAHNHAAAIASRRPFTFSMPMRIAAMVALIAFAAVALIVALRWRASGPPPTNDPEVTAVSQPTPLASPQAPSLAPSPSIANPPKLAENPPSKTPDERRGTVLVALKDGTNEISIDKGGNVIGLPSLPAESRQAVKEALTGEPLSRPDVLDQVATAPVSVRSSTGNEERISITYPTNTVIQESKPTLRWIPSKKAEGYRIEIAEETFRQIAKSEDLPATSQSWTSPAPLKRGGIYTWTIRAVNKGGELSGSTSQGKFKILGEDSVRELKRLRSSQSHLAVGLFYAREGMIAEAEREFQILAKANPNSTVLQRLIQQIRGWMRQQ